MKKKITMLAIALLSITTIKAQCWAYFSSYVSPSNNGTVSFVDSVYTTGIISYQWNFGDGTTSYYQNPTHVFTTGTHYVCLTVSDSLGTNTCTYCDSVTVINNAPPPCQAGFVVYDSAGYAYAYDQSTGSNLTYSWDFGDSTYSTAGGSVVHQYANYGTYTICLTIANIATGCSDTYCNQYTYSNGNTGACQGIVNVNFTAADSSGVTFFSNTPSGVNQVYHWDFGDGNTSAALGNAAHQYAAAGTYLVCLTVYETGGGTDSCQQCQYVTVGNPVGGCSANFVVVHDSVNIYNYTVYNYAQGSGNSTLSYFWSFGDGSSSTSPYPTHSYTGSGPYTLCLTITAIGALGDTCTATHCDSIIPGMAPSQVTTLTVVNPLTVGISQHSSIVETLNNYPNPFTNTTAINYSIKQNSSVELSVMDLLGNKITTIENGNKSAGNYKTEWNASDIAAGIYMLQLKIDNRVLTKKLVITK